MAQTPSQRLRALRKRIESTKETQRKKREQRQEKTEQVKRKASNTKRRAQRAVAKRTAPIEDEVRKSKQEASFIAAELGVSVAEAQKVVEEGNALLSSAKAAGGLSALDLDGDGDTDLLSDLDGLGVGGGDDVDDIPMSLDPTKPVLDFAGDLEEPLFKEDVVVDLDATKPLDGEIEF